MASPYAVFPHGNYDVRSEIEWDFDDEEVEIPLAPGEEIIVSRGLDHVQTNLQGGHAALPGRKILVATFSRLSYNSDQRFRTIIAALLAMKVDGEPRWLYNTVENSVSSTWTGETASGPTADGAGNNVTNETGRMLCIYKGSIRAAIIAARKAMSLTLRFHEVFRSDVTWS